MMIRSPLSPNVSLVQNQDWTYASCSQCKARLHGPVGRALPSKELETFVTLHKHASDTSPGVVSARQPQPTGAE